MITNATILRIDTPSTADTAGDVQFVQGQPLNVRCAVMPLGADEKFVEQAVEQRSSSKLTVLQRSLNVALAAAGYPSDVPTPAAGQRVTFGLDRGATETLRIRMTDSATKGALSNYVLTLESE